MVWSAEMLTGNAMGSADRGGRWLLVVVHLAWLRGWAKLLVLFEWVCPPSPTPHGSSSAEMLFR